MRLVSLVQAIFFFGVISMASAAQPFVTLAQLKAQLDSSQRVKGKGNSSEAARAATYIFGAGDAYEISGDLCFPSNTGGDDIVSAVASYLRDHAKDEPVAECLKVGCEASWGVRQALAARFPCVNVP